MNSREIKGNKGINNARFNYPYAIPIYARITVKNGQTVHVTSWEEGKLRRF